MTKTSVAVALLFAVSSAAACSDQRTGSGSGSENVASTKAAIQGGSDDTGHPFALGICLEAGSRSDCENGTSGICSGALIAPNLVVTARHCIQDTGAPTIDCATSVFGAQRPGQIYVTTSATFAGTTDPDWLDISSIDVPTPTAVCGNDIALITLAANIPASVATPIIPVVEYPMSDHKLYALKETAIGYGGTGAVPEGQTPPGAGTRRILENIQIVCDANDPDTLAGCAGAFDGGDPIASPNEFFTGNGTCEGDSGSSAYEQSNFDKGVYYSFGVLSRGGSTGTTCEGGVYTRLDAWRDLIVQTVTTAAAAGGYPIPSWTAVAPIVPDAGPAPVPGTGQLGDGCTGDPDCASLICRSSTCTQKCDDTNTCPDGYDCNGGFCLASATPADNGGTTVTTTSGCGCKLAGGPNNPVPWKSSSSLIALGAVALLRRRRGARNRRTR